MNTLAIQIASKRRARAEKRVIELTHKRIGYELIPLCKQCVPDWMLGFIIDLPDITQLSNYEDILIAQHEHKIAIRDEVSVRCRDWTSTRP